MSTLFDEFKKMVEEEFGYTVVKSKKQEHDTFESLFGIDATSFAQYQIPYAVSEQYAGYYNTKPSEQNLELMVDAKFAVKVAMLVALAA